MIRGFAARWLTLVGCFAVVSLSSAGFAQAPKVSFPEGRRHFIVIVDASATFATDSGVQGSSEAKRDALASIEGDLIGLMYPTAASAKGGWFHEPTDFVTVIQAGIYPSEDRSRPDGIFMRRPIWADTHVGRRRLTAALHPRQGPPAFSRKWALSVGLAYAAVPGVPVQDTYVIVISGDDPNDSRPDSTLNLSAAAKRLLAAKQQLIASSVSLEGASPANELWSEKAVGIPPDQVRLTIYRAVPLSTGAAAEAFRRLDPLKSLRISPAGEALTASIAGENALRGSQSTLSLEGEGRSRTTTQLLIEGEAKVNLGNVPGKEGVVTLSVLRRASNPVLGIQKFEVTYRKKILLPSGIRFRWTLGFIFAFVVVLSGAVRMYRQAIYSKQFKLWLPGYVTSFELPPIGEHASSAHLARRASENGDFAAVLTLPSPLLRALFYRRSTLYWDPMLAVPKFPNAEAAKLTQLPTVVKFIWQDRPSGSGEFQLAIEGPVGFGGNRRTEINVRYLALPAATAPKLD